MIRKTVRRRPEFESLESMVLLSGMAMGTEHAVAAPVAIDATSPLAGTVVGRYHIAKSGEISFSAKGNLSPAGHLKLRGKLPSITDIGPQSLTMTTRHGRITAALSALALGMPETYQITDATGKYKVLIGDSGVAALSAVNSARTPTKGYFAITFA